MALVFKRRWGNFMDEILTKKFARRIGGTYWWTMEPHAMGSLHVHMVIKCEDSIERLIEKNIIRSSFAVTSPETCDHMVTYQSHTCTTYCLIKDTKFCRFYYPKKHFPATHVDHEGNVVYECFAGD